MDLNKVVKIAKKDGNVEALKGEGQFILRLNAQGKNNGGCQN